MPLSRGEFVKACASALMGIGASPGVLAGRSSPEVALPPTTASRFRPHIDTRFLVTMPQGRTSVLVLSKVIERAPTQNVEQFSVVLHGPAAEPLNDGTYRFQHPVLGRMDLFINKVGSGDPLRARYQACFGYVRT